MLQQDEQISHQDSEFAHWAHYESESPVLHPNQRLSFYSPQNQPSNPSYHHHEDHLRHDTLPLLSGGLRSDPEVISPIVVSDKDAFAARGLLALISSEDVTPTLGARPGIGFHGRMTSGSTPLTRIDENSYTDVTTTRPAASKRTTALLRHYRYEVAPWVHSSIPAFPYLVTMFRLTLIDSSIYAICINLSALQHFNTPLTRSKFFGHLSYCPKPRFVIGTWMGARHQSSIGLPHRWIYQS